MCKVYVHSTLPRPHLWDFTRFVVVGRPISRGGEQMKRKIIPHFRHVGKLVQHFVSLASAQNQQRVQIAAVFQAMLGNSSGSANFLCQNPMHMPVTKYMTKTLHND